jgi:hypothetical protein
MPKKKETESNSSIGKKIQSLRIATPSKSEGLINIKLKFEIKNLKNYIYE